MLVITPVWNKPICTYFKAMAFLWIMELSKPSSEKPSFSSCQNKVFSPGSYVYIPHPGGCLGLFFFFFQTKQEEIISRVPSFSIFHSSFITSKSRFPELSGFLTLQKQVSHSVWKLIRWVINKMSFSIYSAKKE